MEDPRLRDAGIAQEPKVVEQHSRGLAHECRIRPLISSQIEKIEPGTGAKFVAFQLIATDEIEGYTVAQESAR
jgi:hypothetical protein